MRRLDAGNTYVHMAVQAIAGGTRPPAPPPGCHWMDRAREHGVLTVLAAHLDDAGDPALRRVRRLNAAQGLRTAADLATVRAALTQAGVDWLVFKGPVLSEVVYQRPGTRSYTDVDVLIAPDDLPVARAALQDHGAVAFGSAWETKQADGFGEMSFVLPHGTALDLHWDVLNSASMRRGFSVGTATLMAGARTVQLAAGPVRTFNALDTALHVALHACKSGADQLRWMLDLHQSLLRLEDPGSELLARARTLGVELALRMMVGRLGRFVDPGAARRLELPRPRAGQATWLAADALAMSLFPPGSRSEGRFSAAVVAVSVRSGAAASWAALAANLPGVVRTRRGRATIRAGTGCVEEPAGCAPAGSPRRAGDSRW